MQNILCIYSDNRESYKDYEEFIDNDWQYFVNKMQFKLNSAMYSDISDHLPITVHIETGSCENKVYPNVFRQRPYDQSSFDCFNNDLCKYDN